MVKKIFFLGFIILVVLGIIFAGFIKRGCKKDNPAVKKYQDNSQPVMEDEVILEKMSFVEEEKTQPEENKLDETNKKEILVDEQGHPFVF